MIKKNQLDGLRDRVLFAAQQFYSLQAKAISEAWERFQGTYQQALGDIIGCGLHTDAVMDQAEHFAALRLLKDHPRGDVARSKLVTLILRAGTVVVTGDQPSVIVPPWHPERIKALAVKLRRAAGLIKCLHAVREALWMVYGTQAQRAWCDRLLPEQEFPEFDPHVPF